MTLLTGDQYRESLRDLSPEIYMRGQRIERHWEHPLLKQTVAHLAAHYDTAYHQPEKFAVLSPLTDQLVPRISHHIQTSPEDVIVKARLTREVSARRICAGCMSNMLSVAWATFHDVDRDHGTHYLPRFREFVAHLQRSGQVIAWGMMDPKGDRSLPPSKQKRPPDLRIVERRADGIVVAGAKLHTTYGAAVHHIVAVPCRALGPDDKEFAVSFAVPVDAKGLKLIARPSPGPSREVSIESPLSSHYLGVECLSLFDNVFVPEDSIFMCGEYDKAANLPFYFSCLHRQSKCACSAGHTDLLIGTAALLAEANGLGMKVGHIRDKITDMMMAASTAFGCSLGAAANGSLHESGVFLPDPVIANSGLSFIRSRLPEHLVHIHDIGGGLIVTMPTEADWNNPALRPFIDTALSGGPGYTTEERLRVMNLAQDLAASRLTGTLLGFSINAAGSPVTNKIVMRTLYDLEGAKRIAREIAGIDDKKGAD